VRRLEMHGRNRDELEKGVERMKKSIRSRKTRIALRLIPVAVAAVILCFALIQSRQPDERRDRSVAGRATPDSVVQIGPEILNALQEVARLEVLVGNVDQELGRHLEDIFVGMRIGEININARYNYQITAGIDLSRVTARDIEVDYPGGDCRVTVTLPWPDITGIRRIGTDTDVSESTFFRRSNALTHETLAQMEARARELVEERCREMGIVDMAADSCRSEIESLLMRIGADVVVVRFN
jgi:hypothetical protein